MNMSTIIVKFDFDFVHRYSNAADSVDYLRNRHRHKFFTQVEIQVFHDDREIEFLMLKDEIISNCIKLDQWPDTMSCEMMCDEIINYLKDKYGSNRYICVTVFEDNENGGRKYYDPIR